QKSATVDNCRFLNNYATLYGGAINTQGYIVINNSYFENNTAEIRGGAITLRGGNGTIENSNFVSNKVERENPTYQQQGGAIAVDGSQVYLINNTLRENTAFNGSDIFLKTGIIYNLTTEVLNTTAVEDEEFDIRVKVHDDNGNNVSGVNVTVPLDTYSYKIYIQDGMGTFTVKDSINAGNYSVVAVIDTIATDAQNNLKGSILIEPTTLDNYAKVEGYINDSTGELVLNNGVKRGISEETININKNIVIDANGMNINANMGNVFKIYNADVTIKNVVINNSYGLVGSVLDASQSNVIFENLTLFDNEVYNF
ncbi:MAG: hypothetical protein Q4Q22_09545, partial [Methanosphaera sp.]|nr:hypothetical protein [Methanosphaera sp.]